MMLGKSQYGAGYTAKDIHVCGNENTLTQWVYYALHDYGYVDIYLNGSFRFLS